MRDSALAVFLLTASVLASGAGRTYAEPLNSVAKQLAKALPEHPEHQIAVLPFVYPDGGLSSGSTLVSERLITCLSTRKHLKIVDRSQLPQLLEEMRLESSGVTPPATSQNWGKILSVDAIVTGTLVDEGNGRTEIHARLVQTETGLLLAAASTIIPRTWADRPVKPERAPEAYLPEPSVRPGAAPASAQNVSDTDRLIRDPVLPPDSFEIVRRLYETSPDPKVRAGALYSMGIILERQGRLQEAAAAYRRVLTEFPEQPKLTTDALGRLWAQNQGR